MRNTKMREKMRNGHCSQRSIPYSLKDIPMFTRVICYFEELSLNTLHANPFLIFRKFFPHFCIPHFFAFLPFLWDIGNHGGLSPVDSEFILLFDRKWWTNNFGEGKAEFGLMVKAWGYMASIWVKFLFFENFGKLFALKM